MEEAPRVLPFPFLHQVATQTAPPSVQGGHGADGPATSSWLGDEDEHNPSDLSGHGSKPLDEKDKRDEEAQPSIG